MLFLLKYCITQIAEADSSPGPLREGEVGDSEAALEPRLGIGEVHDQEQSGRRGPVPRRLAAAVERPESVEREAQT
jgi:hypothetical protein